MDEIIKLVLVAFLGALTPILIARYSKPKRERDAALSQIYLHLADMTADQLEERINLIGKLDNRIGGLTSENLNMLAEISQLKGLREERTEQLEALEAHMSALQQQIDKDARERNELRKKISDFEVKNRAMWQYLLALLEQMKRQDIVPVEPPEGLKSDPEIMKIIQDIKAKRDK